jgi:hypothetical protein
MVQIHSFPHIYSALEVFFTAGGKKKKKKRININKLKRV